MLYQKFSWAAVAWHLLQAIVTCALTIWLDTLKGPRKGIFPLYKPVHIWKKALNDTNNPIAHDVHVDLVMDSVGTLDVRWSIVAFFAMSAAFPAAILWFDANPAYRFFEYAISASVMIMTIAVETGINDVYTLQCMFVLTFITMIMGFIAEFAPQPVSWIAHIAAWISFLSAYSPILDAFLQSDARSPIDAPGFVSVIVFLQFVLFAAFGFVQVYELFIHVDDNGNSAEHQELLTTAPPPPEHTDEKIWIHLAYVTLSLIAKTILAWLVLAPILV